MTLHEMLINEEYVKGIYNSIGNNPRVPISHGFSHIKAVLSIPSGKIFRVYQKLY